jgi:phosphate-selective porin OprO/OprP
MHGGIMKKVFTFFLMSLLTALFVYPMTTIAKEDKNKSLNETLLEILKEKKIIEKEEYEELKKQAQDEEAAKNAKASAGFKKGFFIESADKQSRMKFDGRFHGDFKRYLGDQPDHASFFVRRARLCVSGTVYKDYDFRLEPEFGKGDPRLNDGFMNIRHFPQAQLMFGQFKIPFSMEELHSDNWIDFIERSVANKLAPSRDVGVMLHGGIQDELLYYQLGLFNGYQYNQASDPDGGKDIAFRLVIAPFKKSGLKPSEGLRIGTAFTYGRVNLSGDEWWNSGDFKTAAGTKYLDMESVRQDGYRLREGLELYWDWGETALKAEYMIVKLDGVKRGNLEDDFDLKGGYISISHCLTGERFVYKKGKPGRIIPLRNFESGSEGLGAWQMGARLEFLDAEQGLLDLGYVDSSLYTNKAAGFTIGLNWYPNEIIRFMFNFNHIRFGDSITIRGKTFADEDVILGRFQVAL